MSISDGLPEWRFLTPNSGVYPSKSKNFQKETEKDIESISQEFFNVDHRETTHNRLVLCSSHSGTTSFKKS